MPKDGKAITKWNDKDSAWKNVYEGIKHVVDKISKPEINPDFQNQLLKNSFDTTPLDKQFVYPDITTKDKTADVNLEHNEINSEKLIAINTFDNPYILLYGEEQSGKTALAHILFLRYMKAGFYPVLMEGNKIPKSGALKKATQKEYKNQFSGSIHVPKEKRILIIDDVDERKKITKEDFDKFILSIRDHFQGAILLANQLTNIPSEKSKYKYFKSYSILVFGHKKREELIKKCISLHEDTDFDYQNKQHLNRLDQCTSSINIIIGHNIVPSYPFFILSIFNSIELISPNQDLQQTSYGHCYQAMITISLSKIHIIVEEIDSYFNFLTHLAYWMFDNNVRNISDTQLQDFLKKYGKKFIVPRGRNFSEILVSANILREKNNLYNFGYIYIYYYFVAKYIAENINNKKEVINKLISKVYQKDSANILVFITHHTKDKNLIENITDYTHNIFSQYKEASLSGDEKGFIKELHSIFNNITLPGSTHSVEKERSKELEIKDKQRSTNDTDAEQMNTENSTLIEIKKSARTMEIIGQILRNQYGSLEKEKLKILFKEAQNVGLRLLKSFMEFMLNERTIIEKFIQSRLEQISKKESSPEKIEQISKVIVDQMSYGILWGWLHKIIHSIGYYKIVDIANSVNTESNTVASKLINLYIHTWHKKDLDVDRIRILYKELQDEKNTQAICLLKHIVAQYIYMHPIKYKKKQKIASLLGFSIQNQRLAEKRLK